jgi:hypothetical protein
MFVRTIGGGATPVANAWQRIWTDGYDGSGSGLDADTVDGIEASGFATATHTHTKSVGIAVADADTALAVADGKVPFTVPAEINGWDLTAVTASCPTAGSANTTDVQIRRQRAAATADMLSTKVTISASAYTASDGVVNGSNDDVATGDMLFIDIDAISTGAQGLSVTLTFTKP